MRSGERGVLIVCLGVLAFAGPARAGGAAEEIESARQRARAHEVAATEEREEGYPRLVGELLVEVESDTSLDSSGSQQFLTLEPSFSLQLSESFSLEAGFVLEPVADPPPGDDAWFDDQGLFVETLFLRWSQRRFSLHIGKFDPAFGVAWDAAPGIYGVDFAEDYELSERLGFGASVELGGETVGRHRLGADAFWLDTSPLSRSLFRDRGRTRPADGGPGNTGSPESFALSLFGEGIPPLPGLSYNLGFARQQRADAGGRTEHDVVAGLVYSFSPAPALDVELLSEYAHLRHAGGEAASRHYFTQGAEVTWRGWNAAVAYSRRWQGGRGVPRHDDLLQVSAGYAWEIGPDARFGLVGADLGWRRCRESGDGADLFGGRVSYSLAF